MNSSIPALALGLDLALGQGLALTIILLYPILVTDLIRSAAVKKPLGLTAVKKPLSSTAVQNLLSFVPLDGLLSTVAVKILGTVIIKGVVRLMAVWYVSTLHISRPLAYRTTKS